jgi:hypothetical protein
MGEVRGRCVGHAQGGSWGAWNPGHVKNKFGGKAGNSLLAASVLVCASLALLFTGSSWAQERPAKAFAVARTAAVTPRAMAYRAARETVVQGTVIQYVETAEAPPIGAHAKVQTAVGIVDVHLGPGSYLRGKNFSLSAGDAVRIVGVQAAGKGANVFLARTVERGSDTLVLRSPRGFLVGTGGARAQAAASGAQGLQRGAAR